MGVCGLYKLEWQTTMYSTTATDLFFYKLWLMKSTEAKTFYHTQEQERSACAVIHFLTFSTWTLSHFLSFWLFGKQFLCGSKGIENRDSLIRSTIGGQSEGCQTECTVWKTRETREGHVMFLQSFSNLSARFLSPSGSLKCNCPILGSLFVP